MYQRRPTKLKVTVGLWPESTHRQIGTSEFLVLKEPPVIELGAVEAAPSKARSVGFLAQLQHWFWSELSDDALILGWNIR